MVQYQEMISAYIQAALQNIAPEGKIEIIFPEGDIKYLGNGEFIGRIKINDWSLVENLLDSTDQSIAFGESYAHKDVEIEGNESAILGILYASVKNRYLSPFQNVAPDTTQDKFENTEQSDYVRAIYDNMGELYQLFLDDNTMCYTSGWFPQMTPTFSHAAAEIAETLTGVDYQMRIKDLLDSRISQDQTSIVEGQIKKFQRIKWKLLKEVSNSKELIRLLDIGCGWGSLSSYLSKGRNVQITGITLSEKQAQYIKTHFDSETLDKISIVVSNFFEFTTDKKFDEVVSVGMIEHVGEQRLGEYALKIREVMTDEGTVVIHGMTNTANLPMNPFLDKYIFPGAYIPTLSQVIGSFEQSGFDLKHYEGWRNSYAVTLELWETAYRWNKLKIMSYWETMKEKNPSAFPESSEYYYRIWLFYLISARSAFEYGVVRVGQFVFTPTENKHFRDDFSVQLERNYEA